ncbi:MAG: Rpn family recombination-promoting nuclease/putative transposase [Defluviitaleaceae bacterium]|nr:Rpn family recombination-promoting nuclease/putative transposase [Defluviitaleaceae bacterium]
MPVTSDFVFKLIFGSQENVDILAGLLKSVLDIPDEEYESIAIIDPHVKKSSANDKYSILDVKVNTKSGKIVHIEIQVKPLPELRERTVYQQSKMITEQMSSGDNWAKIRRAVSIIITDYNFFEDGAEYHQQFRYRTKSGMEFTDLKEINTLELSKLPPSEDGTNLWYWMKFIKSNDREVLDMIAKRSPQMEKAVGVLKELSADEQTRMLFEAHEKARRDMASMVGGAKKERSVEIALKLLGRNRPIDEIIEDTDLTFEEIQSLKATV